MTCTCIHGFLRPPQIHVHSAYCVFCIKRAVTITGKIKSDKMTNGFHVNARGNVVLIVFKITIIFGGLGVGVGEGGRGGGGGVGGEC